VVTATYHVLIVCNFSEVLLLFAFPDIHYFWFFVQGLRFQRCLKKILVAVFYFHLSLIFLICKIRSSRDVFTCNSSRDEYHILLCITFLLLHGKFYHLKTVVSRGTIRILILWMSKD
jgi:hypothetical protein